MSGIVRIFSLKTYMELIIIFMQFRMKEIYALRVGEFQRVKVGIS
jgi:hypothetical protein